MYILQTKTLCKGDHTELNFEGLEMQKWDILMDGAQWVDFKKYHLSSHHVYFWRYGR